MSQRRKFNSQFKFKVVVEALSERLPLHELAKKHELLPTRSAPGRRSSWPKARMSFAGRTVPVKKKRRMSTSCTE